MDITLERILSLIPRKPDGKFKHGAKKIFAESIGLHHPQIISDWEAGRNRSYVNYLYQISKQYHVSVEWLKGDTDIKEEANEQYSPDPQIDELVSLLRKASPEVRSMTIAFLRAAEENIKKHED